jgi:hypothetical protein
MTKGIRVEVDNEFYDWLSHEQEARRRRTGKKPALSAIILDICYSRMKKNESVQNVQVVQKFLDEVEGKNYYKNKNADKEFAITQTRLTKKEAELKTLETELSQKEKFLNEKEHRIYVALEKQMQQKNDLIDFKEKINEKNLEGSHNKLLVESLEKQVAEKNNTIMELRNEAKQAHEKIIKILNDVDKKTEKGIFEKYIQPFLPSLINIAGCLIMNNKLNDIKELSPALKDIDRIFKQLKPEEQKELSNLLSETVHKNVHYKP